MKIDRKVQAVDGITIQQLWDFPKGFPSMARKIASIIED
jgi:hypothetical protein